MSQTQHADDSAQDKNAKIPLLNGLTVDVKPCDSGGVHLAVHADGSHPATAGIRTIAESAAVDPADAKRVRTRSRADVGPSLMARTADDAQRLAEAVERMA